MLLESYEVRLSMQGPVIYFKYTNGTTTRILLQPEQAQQLRKDIKKVMKVSVR